MKNQTNEKISLWPLLAAVFIFALVIIAILYPERTNSIKPQEDAKSNENLASPLYRDADEAIKKRDHQHLQALLSKDPSLVKSMPIDKWGRKKSLLTAATYWEDEVSVGILLNNGADPNGKEGAVPLDDAITSLNMLPFDAPREITSLRLHIPSESERILQYMRNAQQTRARIILTLLNAGANYNVAISNGDKDSPNLFEALTMSLCNSIYYDPEVLVLFRESGIIFKREPGSETIFQQHNLVNAMNGVLDPDCVIFMYGH
jgi:hypothetical protein